MQTNYIFLNSSRCVVHVSNEVLQRSLKIILKLIG